MPLLVGQIEKSKTVYGTVTGQKSPRLYDTARSMPGKKKWVDNVLYFELSGANIEFLRSRHPEATWTPEMESRYQEIVNTRALEQSVREAKMNGINFIENFPFKLPPFKHQKEAFSLSGTKPYFGYFMEMGTGKTKVTIDNAALLISEGLIDTILIVAPNGVHAQWVNEQIPEHMPAFVNYVSFKYFSGCDKGKKNQEALEAFWESDKIRVLAMNVESFSHDSGVEFASKFIRSGTTLMIVDESSKIKNIGSKRTKNILKLRDMAPFRRALSGTPVTQGVEDLYAQLLFLHEDILGHSSFYTFRNEFCVMGGYENKEIVGYRNLEGLQQRLDGHTIRVLKEDCLDLPEKMFVNREVEMTEEQARLYSELKKHFIAEISENQSVEAPLAVVRLLRLQEILSGYTKDETGLIHEIPNNRIDDLIEVIEEVPGKVIVWARFKYDAQMIGQRLEKEGIEFALYGGSVPAEKRPAVIQRFREDPKCKVFLTNTQMGGTGLNLTCASTAVYYNLDFNLENFLQSQDRIHRIGATQKCTYVLLQARGTLDVKIASALKSKKDLATMVLDIRDYI